LNDNRLKKVDFWKIFNKKQELFVTISALPFDFFLLKIHNIATAIRRTKTPLTDATMGVTVIFFSFSLHCPDSHRYGF